MKIELQNEDPIHKYPFKIPFKLQEPLKEELKRLLDLGIIKESTSPYAFSAFPILKKNNNIRLIIDHRPLNKITVPDSFPFPDLHDEIRSIPQSDWFSQIDLSMGYHQIELDKKSQKYSSFVTQYGQYEFTRVPFGLTNAPRVFQRVIRKLLGHLKFVRTFLDDILVFSKTREEHFQHSSSILKILSENNISVSFDKSHFFQKEVRYLGHVISGEGIKQKKGLLPKIEKLLPPKILKGIQKICGFINWFRPFIRSLSLKSKPITDKLSKDKKFSWTEKDSEVVRQFTEQLKEEICLSYPNYSLPFQLQTDASDYCMDAVLKLGNSLIAFFSRKFSSVQSRYTTSEKELLAIIESLKFFKNMIYLSKIEIQTDHLNLIHNNLDVYSNRMQRWKLLLTEYDIVWSFIEGKKMSQLTFFQDIAKRVESQKCLPTK